MQTIQTEVVASLIKILSTAGSPRRGLRGQAGGARPGARSAHLLDLNTTLTHSAAPRACGAYDRTQRRSKLTETCRAMGSGDDALRREFGSSGTYRRHDTDITRANAAPDTVRVPPRRRPPASRARPGPSARRRRKRPSAGAPPAPTRRAGCDVARKAETFTREIRSSPAPRTE
ncbi:hypothetical protein EVAR_21090_1 [Eumeta japonica]|uniref:Uncharacterized protein n=1 Tax=Eumeta variegata TaxID=151549 RepID=A0A4C1V186_EUMVA|nr:hypothetical protein EVAR_21090_1 [Eumeta japonica]